MNKTKKIRELEAERNEYREGLKNAIAEIVNMERDKQAFGREMETIFDVIADVDQKDSGFRSLWLRVKQALPWRTR